MKGKAIGAEKYLLALHLPPEQHLPGPLTLVFLEGDGPEMVLSGLRHQTGGVVNKEKKSEV